ncbi:hypothetical protein [Lysinibacillus xylanilyticus]
MKNVKKVKPERKMKVMLEDNQLKQFFKSFDVTKFEIRVLGLTSC